MARELQRRQPVRSVQLLLVLLLLLVPALCAATGSSAEVIEEALAARDSFEHERAIDLLTQAVEQEADESAAAPLLWHLGALLVEARRGDEAHEVFARAARTGVPPELRMVVSPNILADIEAARAAVPPATPERDDTAAPAVAAPDWAPDTTTATEDTPVVPPEPPRADPPAASPDDGLPALVLAGGTLTLAGAAVAIGGAAVWSVGLAEHAQAVSAPGQTAAAQHNATSAPLQLGGQVALGVGAATIAVGLGVAALGWE